MNIALRPTNKAHPVQPVASRSNSSSSETRMQCERPQGCWLTQRRFESVLARYDGQRRGELGEGVLGAGARGLPRGPATATERQKVVFAPEGIVLPAVHSRCVLCCFGSLGTSMCLAGSSIWRGSVPAVENNTYLVPGTRIRAHLHPATYVGVDFDC